MSLNWDARNVKDWKEVPENTRYLMTMSTMLVGLGEITEKNAKQFFSRIDFVQKLCGPLAWDAKGKDHLITLEEVQRFIGLKTNVSNESRTVFIKRYTRDVL